MDLYEVLKQTGHSGMIEGYCRLCNSDGSPMNGEVFYRSKSTLPVKINFSYGVYALGSYEFKATNFNNNIFGRLILENGRGEIRIVLFVQIGKESSAYCKFLATYYHKK
jgi:hypothetical protein